MSKTKYKDFYWFLFLIFILDLLFHWHEILHVPPLESHLWRQTDSLTTIQSYFYDHTPFFKPHTNDYSDFTKNTTLTEFPILYYISSLFWKFTGEVYWVPRLLNLIFSIVGVFALFKITKHFTKSLFLALILVVLVFSSPTFSIYAISFLPNIPALSLIFYAWYQAIKFHDSKIIKHLFFCFIAITFACLLKITMAISLFIFLSLAIYYYWKKSFDKKTIFIIFTFFFTTIILVFSWVLYLKNYNSNNASESLFEAFSVFKHSAKEFKAIFDKSFFENLFLLENKFFYIFILLVSGFNYFQIINRKEFVLGIIHLLFVIGLTVYFLLFCFSFISHEYYLLDFTPLILLHLITFFYFIKEYRKIKITRISLTFLSLFFLSYSVAHTISKHFEANTPFKKVLSLHISKSDKEFYDYYRFASGKRIHLLKYRKLLKELNISREEQVIVLPDTSPNSPLFFLNLRGATSYHFPSFRSFLESMKLFKKHNYRYLINFNKSDLELEKNISSIQNKKIIFEDDNIIIFRLY
jgi:hypothetical protein